jgi:hypothetical protein
VRHRRPHQVEDIGTQAGARDRIDDLIGMSDDIAQPGLQGGGRRRQ